jgi:hypothetical protein
MEVTVRDVKLTCQFELSPEAIAMRYAVVNAGETDIYLMDAYPAVDQSTRTAFADFKSVYVCWKSPSLALVLKGIPPLPSDKLVTVRVMPLATKIAPRGEVQRSISVPLPLREQSPWYYPPLEEKNYEKTTIRTIDFAIQFLRSTVEGFEAEPVDFAPDLYRVRGKRTVGQAETIHYEIDAREVNFWKRRDRFTRL